MKNRVLFVIVLFLISMESVESQWKPAGDKIKTKWGENLDPQNVLSEYPRPLMERNEWLNLNGMWQYAIAPKGSDEPKVYDGNILVPFAIESSLSGVQKKVGKNNVLWYKRTFRCASEWKGKNVLLHFGAVDWKTEVWINGIKVGCHEGGFTPFSFNITPFLHKGEQKIVVRVWDPTDDGPQPRGKQVNQPNSIWYTSVTGIWQTVWLEPVSKKYIAAIKTTPDIDENSAFINTTICNENFGDVVEIKVKENGKIIKVEKAEATNKIEIHIANPRLWNTDDPFLYDMEISLQSDGKVVDHVESYFAMRKISIGRDENGIMRMQLNNKNVFQFGPLDQGWWPDGLYTAPTDEALKYDIQKVKELGFNMIRKHVKVEPARWYSYCDKIGMLVWQDMPSGDREQEWQQYNYFKGTELQRSEHSETIYRKEWKDIMDNLYSNPCIVVWVPFNERWGQFKTEEIVKWTKQYDNSRLVDPASGGNHFAVGDMLDIHHYPGPAIKLMDPQRATVLGEFGGIGFAMKDHLWDPDRNWGYVQYKSIDEVTDEYVRFAEDLKNMVKTGYAAAVYTQTSDVETEVNGLMTYDRKVLKLDMDRVKKINKEVISEVK